MAKGKDKVKKKGLKDREISVPFPEAPPQADAMVLERNPQGPGIGTPPMVQFICHNCGDSFERPRRGGRQPMYCSDRCRSQANYQNPGPNRTTRAATGGSSTPRRTAADTELLDYILSGTEFVINDQTNALSIEHTKLEIPERLMPGLMTAYRRISEPAPEPIVHMPTAAQQGVEEQQDAAQIKAEEKAEKAKKKAKKAKKNKNASDD